MVNAPKRVDTNLARFLKTANEYMQAAYGVRYMDVAEEIDGGFDRLRNAMVRKEDPESFIRAAATRCGFAACRPLPGGPPRAPAHTRFGARMAGKHNRHKAALVEFARVSDEWTLGADGRVYQERDSDLLRIDPVRDKSRDVWGFSVSIATGAELVRGNGGVRPSQDAHFEQVAAARDIGDVCNRVIDCDLGASATMTR